MLTSADRQGFLPTDVAQCLARSHTTEYSVSHGVEQVQAPPPERCPNSPPQNSISAGLHTAIARSWQTTFGQSDRLKALHDGLLGQIQVLLLCAQQQRDRR